MADDKTDITKSLERLNEELRAFESVKDTIEEISGKMKEADKNEDRDFQLRMLGLQLKYGLLASLMTILFSAAISYITAIITISINLPNQEPLSIIFIVVTIVLIATIVGCSIAVGIVMRNEVANLRNGKTTQNK